MYEDSKAQVDAAYQAYLEAFTASDMDRLNKRVRFPVTLITEDGVETLDTYPITPAELKAQTGWHTTVDSDYEIVCASDTKAHVILRNAKRLRADGSLIEEISAFYAFTKTDEGWKIYVVSGVTFPANPA